MTIIQAVPNVSEGQNRDVIDALVHAVRNSRGSHLLNYSSDSSHNRTVLTLVGDTLGLTTALLRLYETAIPLINLRAHHGEHPRIGIIDVVPFIPLQEASTNDCVSLAQNFGKIVAERFDIPTYLYGEATSNKERNLLENIRRGELNGLASRMEHAEWVPDFGPSKPHPTAGVSAIGVRGPLIAFNVNLATNDLEVAKDIARDLRNNNGLPCVKAIGVRIFNKDLVQVSMNLTNYEITPIYRAFDFVKREAKKRGFGIVNSEIVGLASMNMLIPTALHYLQLDSFKSDQILEARLCPQMTLPPVSTSSEK